MPDTFPTDPILSGTQAQANRRILQAIQALRSGEENENAPSAPRDWQFWVDSTAGSPVLKQYDPTRGSFVHIWSLGNLLNMGPWNGAQDSATGDYDFNDGGVKDSVDILVCVTTAGTFTVTLPNTATAIYRARPLLICNSAGASGLSNVTVASAGSDVIQGETGMDLSPGAAIWLTCLGTGGLWFPIARYGRNVFTTGSDITAKWWQDVLLVDTSGGARAITLRDPANELVGRATPITIINVAGGPANDVTVTPENSKLINGASNKVLADYAAATFVHDGSNYLAY